MQWLTVFETVKRSLVKSPGLSARTFRTMRPFGEGGTFRVDLPRHQKVMRAIAFALYFHDNGHKHEGDWRIFTSSFLFADSLHDGRPDPWLPLRRILESGKFTPQAVGPSCDGSVPATPATPRRALLLRT